MGLLYLCSTMLAIIHLVTKSSQMDHCFNYTFVFFVIGLRIFYFDQIDIESQARSFRTMCFSWRISFILLSCCTLYGVCNSNCCYVNYAFYYYRLFLMKINREAAYYKHLSLWIRSMMVPFFC